MKLPKKSRSVHSSAFGHSSASGTSIVELAIVIPVLFMITTGVIQFGIMFLVQIGLQNAAEVGARFAVLGAVPVTDVEVEQAARDALPPTMDLANLDPVDVDLFFNVGGVPATRVRMTYNLPLMFPSIIMGGGSGSSFAISATSIMR